MSTHNICFCREIRKIWILFGGKKRLIKSYAHDIVLVLLTSLCNHDILVLF